MNGEAPLEQSDVDRTVSSVEAILQRIDEHASIDAVVKTASGATMIRITPRVEGGRFIAVQAALKFSFPFDAVAAVENVSNGEVQIQMVIATTSEQMSLARDKVKSFTSMKFIYALSNLFLACSAVSFAMLLQHELIYTGTVG